MAVNIQFEFPRWKEVVEANRDRINLFLAATVQTNRGMMFDQEGAHNGRPRWAPLKLRNGQILSRRGTLRKSIAPSRSGGQPGPDGIVSFQGDIITVGTKLGYARMMNDGTTKMPGGVLRPVKAKALKIPLPQGQHANAAGKAAAKAEGMRKMAKRAHELRGSIDNAQTAEAENKYREQLNKVQQRMAKGDVPEGKFIFVKSVKIPARPFDTWNDEDQKELDAAFLNLLTDILNGKN